jgi:hypothetical protein
MLSPISAPPNKSICLIASRNICRLRSSSAPVGLLALPILLVAMLAVVIESGFPIFYRQQRVGQGGELFNIIVDILNIFEEGAPHFQCQSDSLRLREVHVVVA